MEETQIILDVAIRGLHASLPEEPGDVNILQRQHCNLDALTGSQHAGIWDENRHVDFACNARCWSVEVGKAVFDLERPRIIEYGLDLVDKPVLLPEVGRQRVILLA